MITACLLITAVLGACTRPDPVPDKGRGALTLHIDTFATRAGYTDEEPWEKRFRQYNSSGTLKNAVQALIYDSRGVLEFSAMCYPEQDNAFDLSAGKKYIYVLCGCERLSIKTLSSLRAYLASLGDTRGKYLPMRWYGTVTVGSTPVTLTASLKRTVARIALTGIENALRSHQDVEASFAFIGRARVRMDLAMQGTSDDPGLVNTDWSSGLTLAQATAASDLTGINLGAFAYGSALTGLPKCLYTFPTTGLADADKPVLVLAVKVAGNWYYGEIPLNNLKANNTYSVDVRLQEVGPEYPTQIDLSYTLQGWRTGDGTTARF